MDATPINFAASGGGTPSGALPASGRPLFGQASASMLSMKWSALHDAAGVVATLAGQAAVPMSAEVRNFPVAMREAGGWRREFAEQGIEDLSAIMEPGLAALLSAHARGVSASGAAMALWQEFNRARDALLAIAPPPSAGAPVRFT